MYPCTPGSPSDDGSDHPDLVLALTTHEVTPSPPLIPIPPSYVFAPQPGDRRIG
jgi:hypothetical protein